MKNRKYIGSAVLVLALFAAGASFAEESPTTTPEERKTAKAEHKAEHKAAKAEHKAEHMEQRAEMKDTMKNMTPEERKAAKAEYKAEHKAGHKAERIEHRAEHRAERMERNGAVERPAKTERPVR